MKCSLVSCQDVKLHYLSFQTATEEILSKKKKNLWFSFVDFEKDFDRVPRDVVWWALGKLGIEVWLFENVQPNHRNAQSRVGVNGTFSDCFPVLSRLLFIIVMEALSWDSSSGGPKEMLFTDDLTLVTETFEGLKGKPEAIKGALNSKLLRVRKEDKIDGYLWKWWKWYRRRQVSLCCFQKGWRQ